MIRSLFILLVINLGCLLLFMGDTPTPDIRVVFPLSDDSVSYDKSKVFLVSVSNETVPQLLLSTQWDVERMFSIQDKATKDNFPKEFYKLFSPNTTIQSLVYQIKFYNSFAKPETLSFSYTDTVTIKSFWNKQAFKDLMKAVQIPKTDQIILHVKGWKDSIYTPVYEDPVGEGRTLYKLQIPLIHGANSIYFSSGNREKAEVFTASFVNESQPVADRTTRFHNSELEQNCTSCHEGLPSADNGTTMTADCNVCHKQHTTASVLHSPVESKECGTCHSWSAEKKAVVLESGVPETCFGCHDDQKNLIDTAAVQHPVASECTTCHSPHGTDTPKLLKQDVYNLCVGCHQDQKMNHPVGRHPLRFIKSPDGTEELSCVTCHNPHGSPYKALSRVGEDPQMMCNQCH